MWDDELFKANTVIHCQTKDEATCLLEHLYELGYSMGSKSSVTVVVEKTWGEYGDETAYRLDEYKSLSYADVGFYINDFPGVVRVIEFEDVSGGSVPGESDEPTELLGFLEGFAR